MRNTIQGVYNHRRSRVTVDSFTSPIACLETALSTPYPPWYITSTPLCPVCPDPIWYGAEGLDDLKDKAMYGVDDLISREFTDTQRRIRTDETKRPVRRRWDVVGGSLSVPRFLSGNPEVFRHRTKAMSRSHSIEVILLPTIAGSVNDDVAKNVGICLGRTLGVLRSMGYAVGLRTMSFAMYTYANNPFRMDPIWDIHGLDLRIKKPNEVFNPQKVSFALSRTLSRGVFISYLRTTDEFHSSQGQYVVPLDLSDAIYDAVDTLHPGAKVILSSDDLSSRLRQGWPVDKCVDLLLSSVTDYT